MDSGEWVRVFQGSRLQCDLVAGVLEANGIDAVTPPSSGEYVGAMFENSVVLVPSVAAARARKLIDEAEQTEG